MKKGTVIGITVSVLGILALIGLGVYLMLDMQHTGAQTQTSDTPAFVFVNPQTLGETETEMEASAGDSRTKAALLAARAANGELPEHHFIFVGDSRTLGMGNAEKDRKDPCTYVGASGEGYRWFTDTGISQMEEAMKLYPDSPVVLNLGVNDPDSIDRYLELYSTFAKKYPDSAIYFMSVNPVTEESVHVSNTEIADFNARLRDAFPDQYLDCNTYLRIREFETVDGVHYSEDTYRIIHDFVVSQLTA